MHLSARYFLIVLADPTLLSTLPGAASAVLAPRPGGAFRVLTRPPSSNDCCNTRANPDSTAGSIKRTVCDIFWLLSRESGYATRPNPMCYRTSNLTDEICLLRDYSSVTYTVPQLVSRLRFRNIERQDLWQLIFSYHTR